MEVPGLHGSHPPFGGDGAFRHAAAAGLLAAGGLPANPSIRRGCPSAGDFRRREEGHLAKIGIIGYKNPPECADCWKKHGDRRIVLF